MLMNSLRSAASIMSSLISVEKNDFKITLTKDVIISNCKLGEHLYNTDLFETDALSSNSIVIYPRFHFFQQTNPKSILSSASFCAMNYEGRPLAGYKEK